MLVSVPDYIAAAAGLVMIAFGAYRAVAASRRRPVSTPSAWGEVADMVGGLFRLAGTLALLAIGVGLVCGLVFAVVKVLKWMWYA